MNKKFICIKIVIGIICLIIIGVFIHVVVSIEKHITDKIEVVEETVEERIVFDMSLPPSEQKNLKGHVREYMSQVYDYLFHDIKWKNIQDPYPYDYSRLRKKENLKNFYELLKSYQYSPLFYLLFKYEEDVKIFDEMYITYPLNMDDIPVTANYKEKHPKPLFEEFDFIKKEDYETKKYYDTYNEVDYWYEFNYSYSVGVDEDNKEICVGEEKNVSKIFEEEGNEKVGIVWDIKGEEMWPSMETRKFYFKYTIDERGYVDDVIFDRIEIITDDKELDSLIKYERF